MMMKIPKGWAIGLFVSLLLGTAVGPARAQTKSNSNSITIQIVAYVPPMLRLNLDFSNNGTLQLNGRVSEEKNLETRGAQSFSYNNAGSSEFAIQSGATILLGYASLFSNLPGSYSIVVASANGGFLRNREGTSGFQIPYQLMLGDRLSSAQQGNFHFALSGKAGKSSPDFSVALSFGELNATEGDYSDSLSFSIIAG